MNYLGIIPARGGSKGVPKKNLALCGGRPLIHHTFRAVQDSERLEKAWLTTDSQEIADSIQGFSKIKVPELRPISLATDQTSMLEVLKYLVNLAEKEFKSNELIDAFVLLQPTSPLRIGYRIDQAINLFEKESVDALVSICAVPHSCNPVSILSRSENGYVTPYFQEQKKDIFDRNLKPKVWARNGPAIAIFKPSWIKQGVLYPSRTYGFEMKPLESIDVDGPEELFLVDLLLKHA